MLTTRTSLTLYDLPQDAAALETAILAMLANAKKTVTVVLYSLTYRPIIDALVAAHARGVDVQCMLDRSQATDLYNSNATARLIAGIGAANVCIGTTPNGSIIHSKLMQVDNLHWAGGSTNFTNDGIIRETNAALIAANKALAADLNSVFQALWDWNTAPVVNGD